MGFAPVMPPAFDFFAGLRLAIPWSSLDGFNQTVDTGGVAEARGADLYLATGTTINYKAYIRSKDPFKPYYLLEIGKLVTAEFVVTDWSYFENIEACLFLTYSTTSPPSQTYSHFGFKLEALDIYSSNADGETQQKTKVGTLNMGDQRTRLKVGMTYGSDCRFYVNDVLKKIETLHLPSAAADYYIVIGLQTKAAAARHMHLEPFRLEKVW